MIKTERLKWLLETHYNLFHADLISAALESDVIDDAAFIGGCVAIHTAELNDNDEYVPKEFQKLINTDMEYGFVEYKGKKFPTIEIKATLIDSEAEEHEKHTIADYELWKAIESDYADYVEEASVIDNEIFYYCDGGFVASKPSKEKVIEYFRGLTF